MSNFGSSVFVMLVASGTVCENLRANIDKFTTERPEINDAYVDTFEALINTTLKNNFGINSHTEVKIATQIVKSMSKKALKDLGLFNVQFISDFKNDKERKTTIYTTLGFTKCWKKALNRNQNALIELLLTFNNNLSPELEAEITGKGMSAARIDSILSHGDTLNKANITQETLKGIAKVKTAEANKIYNSIYDKSISICTLGRKLFLEDKPRMALFSFQALQRAQIAAGVGENTAVKATSKTKLKTS